MSQALPAATTLPTGPYTKHVETILAQAKGTQRSSKWRRFFQRTAETGISVYNIAAPTVQVVAGSVPWFGPVATAILELLQRVIVRQSPSASATIIRLTHIFQDAAKLSEEVEQLALQVASLLDRIHILLERAKPSSSTVLADSQDAVREHLLQ